MTKDEWIEEVLPFLVILSQTVEAELTTRPQGLAKNLMLYSRNRLVVLIELGQDLIDREAATNGE